MKTKLQKIIQTKTEFNNQTQHKIPNQNAPQNKNQNTPQTQTQTLSSIIFSIPLGDKRPIAKFYRCYLEDVRLGIAEERRRGITQEQFTAANRLASNYERSIGVRSCSIVRVQTNKRFGINTGFETQVAARLEHNKVITQLGKNSCRIIEHFCLQEKPLREYELKQIPQWCKGVAGARLREALDELVEIYKLAGVMDDKGVRGAVEK